MIESLTAIASLAILLVIARDPIADWLHRWPRPGQPHRLHCDWCHCTAPDASWMSLHMLAQHPHTFGGPSFGDGTAPGSGRTRAA